MDDAFGNLGDISDEQTLERLESLFESSGNFASLESPILNDEVPASNNGANNLFSPLDSNAELFSTFSGPVGVSGNALPTTTSSGSSVAAPVSSGGVVPSTTLGDNNGPGSISSSSYTQPSIPPTPQASPAPPAASPIKKSPSPAPTQPQQPPQVLYATKSTVRTTPISQTQQSNLILTAPSAVFSGGNPLVQSAGGTLQIQLQPSSLRNTVPKPQPQLLPKPMQQTAPPTKMTVANSLGHRQLAVSSSILLNQSGQIITTSMAQAPPILINSLGQVVSGSTAASSHQTGTPFLIQQPTGNQVFVLRPSGPGAGTTLLPTSNHQTGGTFLLQQPSGPSTVITAQPQVKIITPQGRMQMQQIQTPSGPKLIAVPVGQTLVQTSAGLISTSSNVLAGLAPSLNLPQQTSLTTSTNSVTVMSSNSIQMSAPSIVTPSAPPVSPVKKKKSKKRLKETELLPQATAANMGPTPSKKPKVVDLGELMKDVGLDLEGFHEDPQQISHSGEESNNLNSAKAAATQMLSSATLMEASPSSGVTASSAAPGSQLVAQIQQPLPLQGNPNQLQLVQGPDGQFVLQSAMQQPTILAQASLDGSTLSIPGAGGTPTIIGALPNTANLNITPSAISASYIGATSLQTLPHRTSLSTTPSLVNTSFINSRPTTSIISAVPSNTVLVNNNTIVKTTPNRPRGGHQSNRVPLYEDDRLPPGWYRKVSQRKSGASAGRYEVFIVGPTGKRFRSKNELKAYFEQTGESTLDPDDFDFSTFGSGRVPSSTPNAPVKNSITPELISGAQTTTSSTSVISSQAQNNPGAVLTLNATLNSSNNSSRQFSIRSKSSNQDNSSPLPNLEPNDSLLQTDSSSSNNNCAPNLLPSIQVPSRSLIEYSSSSLTLSTAKPPVYSSQISRETEDADAQISQLLKTLQEEPHKLSIDPEFIQSLAGGDVDFDGSLTPPPPQLAPAVSKATTTVFSGPSIPLRTLPKTHQVPECTNSVVTTTNLQMRLFNTSSDVIAGTKLKTFIPGVSNTIVSTTTSTPSSSSSSSSPLTNNNNNALPHQIIHVSRGGEIVSASSSGGGVVVNSSLIPSSLSSVPIGGVSTQVRALQNLPSNTRLVRGPNGQYTIQKVQTIELSPDMQQSLKEVQSRIQEIEKQMSKSPQDEAELAQLQTRQQRILSLGRHIPTPPSSSSNILGTPSSSIGMINPGASTISTSSIPQVPDKVTPLPSSGNPAIVAAGGLLGDAGGFRTAVQQQMVVLPSGGAGDGLVTASKSLPPGSGPMVGGPPLTTTTPSGTNIPPLTDQQKRIVAHFKQKMASLPPEQQAQFIAANKASLIRRLNFQPSQIHILCSNRINQQQQQQTMTSAPSVLPAPPPASGSNLLLQPPAFQNTPPPPTEDARGGGFLPPTATAVPSPASSLPPDIPPINKHKKIAWVESQVKKDQNEAVHPNIKTPFRSKEDACKRLLRYHVFHELDPNPEKVIDEELAFSLKSEAILSKFNAMRDKYHYLLMQESMRIATSSEEVMLARLWDSDERQYLSRQKEDFEKRGIILSNLPPIPPCWKDKYIQVLGHPPPPTPPPPPTISKEEKEDPSSDYDEFHSIQNELSRYNNINGIGNTSGSSELFELPPQKMIPSSSSVDEEEDSAVSDEDFGLKDVCGGNGVDAILGTEDPDRRGDEEDDDDDVPLDFGGGSYGQKEVDSVQSAINSILDDRIQTPDINNIAGLLDSFSDATSSDPATESAVNSIPRF